jgi:pseudoazurin
MFTGLCLFLFATTVYAADIQVKLIDKSATEGMLAFEPGFVKAEVNDTIVFTNVSVGHNSHSLLVPTGAQPWKGSFDKEFRVKLEKEGIYLYGCDAHKNMGMVGVVQVGNAINLDEARKKASEESATMLMNKDRFTKALDKVD